jgi:hypothetical protein
MLRKLLPIVNVKVICIVYLTHFYSHISYVIIFWGSSSSVRNVFIVQKRAIRIMLRVGPSSFVERVSKNWIYLQFLVYVFMHWCYLLSNILISIQLTPLFAVGIQGSKINSTYPRWNFPQYRELSTIHLLKYLTS